jgi:hypothetical protein
MFVGTPAKSKTKITGHLCNFKTIDFKLSGVKANCKWSPESFHPPENLRFLTSLPVRNNFLLVFVPMHKSCKDFSEYLTL